MQRLPKLNESVYIIVKADMGSIKIIKGRVCGVLEMRCSFAKFLFQIETQLGVYERFQMDIFESVEEIAKSLKDFVVE